MGSRRSGGEASGGRTEAGLKKGHVGPSTRKGLTEQAKGRVTFVEAEACGADCIVTRNGADFTKSNIVAMMPSEFLAKFP